MLVGLVTAGCGDDFRERADDAIERAEARIEVAAAALNFPEIERRVSAAADAPASGFGEAAERNGQPREGRAVLTVQGPAPGDLPANLDALESSLQASGHQISSKTCGLNNANALITSDGNSPILLEVQRYTGAVTLTLRVDLEHQIYAPEPTNPGEEQCWP